MSGAEPISKTDVDVIRDRITDCQELAHSIRSKSLALNNKAPIRDSEEKTKEISGDVGQELKAKLSSLHGILDDAFNSLSAFV